MLSESIFVLASFTVPMDIGTTPQSMLWLLPLSAAIATIYKVTKLPKITAVNFTKEVMAVFGSIVVFMVITAVVLHAFAWIFTK